MSTTWYQYKVNRRPLTLNSVLCSLPDDARQTECKNISRQICLSQSTSHNWPVAAPSLNACCCYGYQNCLLRVDCLWSYYTALSILEKSHLPGFWHRLLYWSISSCIICRTWSEGPSQPVIMPVSPSNQTLSRSNKSTKYDQKTVMIYIRSFRVKSQMGDKATTWVVYA